MTEWAQVVDAWQLEDWESYRDIARLGRNTRIPEPQRKVLWSILTRVRDGLKARKMRHYAQCVRMGFALYDEAELATAVRRMASSLRAVRRSPK